MPASSSTLSVRGYRELKIAFRYADNEIRKELDNRLRGVAEFVRTDAEELALGRVRNVGVPWSRMRVGVTSKSVYVAPKKRGVRRRGPEGRRRPNLADLLMDRAMQPALDGNQREILAGVDALLADIGRGWERI